MSHLLRRTTQTLLRTTTTTTTTSIYPPRASPLCLPRISPLSATPFYLQARLMAAEPMQRGILMEISSMTRDHLYLDRHSAKVLQDLGMGTLQARNLFNAIRNRVWVPRGARFVFDCLNNREKWSLDESAVPKRYRGNWRDCIGLDNWTGHFSACKIYEIGTHSDAVMGKACHIFAIGILNRAEAEQNHKLMSGGCLLLELAVMYGNHEAAANLITYYADPTRTEMLAPQRVQANTHEAQLLVKELATKRPQDASPEIILTYMREEYGPRKIRLQNPNQLKWGLDVLEYMIKTGFHMDILEPVNPCYKFQHPAQITLQILDHGLTSSLPIPDYPPAKMRELREKTMIQLVDANDPFASMAAAVRKDGPEMFSGPWHALLTTAAKGAIHEAIWLLAIYHIYQEGLLPLAVEEKSLEDSIGLELGRIAMVATIGTPRSMTYYLGLSALCRAAGSYQTGLEILDIALERVKDNSNIPPGWVDTLEDHVRDYTSKNPTQRGYWSEDKIAQYMQYLDPNVHIESARKMYR